MQNKYENQIQVSLACMTSGLEMERAYLFLTFFLQLQACTELKVIVTVKRRGPVHDRCAASTQQAVTTAVDRCSSLDSQHCVNSCRVWHGSTPSSHQRTPAETSTSKDQLFPVSAPPYPLQDFKALYKCCIIIIIIIILNIPRCSHSQLLLL